MEASTPAEGSAGQDIGPGEFIPVATTQAAVGQRDVRLDETTGISSKAAARGTGAGSAGLPPRHLVLVLAVVAIWGTNFVVIHEGLKQFPPLLFATLRF